MNFQTVDSGVQTFAGEKQFECRLCGRMGDVSVDLSTSDVNGEGENNNIVSIAFIQKKIGIKIKVGDGLPTSVCSQCTGQIQLWKQFVRNCLDVQEQFSARLKVTTEPDQVEKFKLEEPTSQQPPADSTENGKKSSRFTLEYLRNKVGRELGEKEADRLQKLIDKGEDRGIYAFLFGSGANQTWPCQICSHIIKGTIREVAKHYQNDHEADPLYPCQLCGKVIKSVHTYKRHRTAHLSEYKCPTCDKVFQDRSKLLAHKVAHSENRPHACGICHKKFKMASHLKSHKARAHLPDSDRLVFTCEICGKRFSAKGNLTTHVQTTHSDERKFVCDICGKGVKTKQALQHHLNSHSGDKLYNCSICDMSFTSRASMASHTRRHTGERPYLCGECGKSFTSSSARSSHKQHVHATSRQHACTFCGKSFKVLRDLRVHQSIHTGEKPYVCPVPSCAKAFRVAANFYAHKKTHRKAQEKEQGKEEQQEQQMCQQSLDAAVAEIGEFIQVNEEQNASVQDLHTMEPMQPSLNDALSQAIQEHLSHNLMVGEGLQDGQQQSMVDFTPVEATDDVTSLEYANVTGNEPMNPQGYLKQILMGPFNVK